MRFDINTVNTKAEQLAHGSFSFGNGPETMLVIGSCRSVPYLNYLQYLNAGARWKIHYIDPFNWNFDQRDNRTDFEETITGLESDPRILKLLADATIYIHEYYNSFGMFNSSRMSPKHIYQFGLNPKADVIIPNFNDIFVLFQDYANFSAGAAMRADMQVLGRLSDELVAKVRDEGIANIEKFHKVCALSDFPEMSDHFAQNWLTKRFFWNSNHVSKHFTVAIFRWLNERLLKLPTTQEFWARVESEDMYATPHTPMTKYDMGAYGIQWNEPVVQLKV